MSILEDLIGKCIGRLTDQEEFDLRYDTASWTATVGQFDSYVKSGVWINETTAEGETAVEAVQNLLMKLEQ